MLKFRNISALLLAVLLLVSLTACGQNNGSVQGQQDDPASVSNPASNPTSKTDRYYSAVHTIMPVVTQIDTACIQDGVFYYISDMLLDNGKFSYNQLLRFDPTTEESTLLDQFDTQRDALNRENGMHGITVDTIAAGADGILVMTAQCYIPLTDESEENADALPEDNLPATTDEGEGEGEDEITYTVNTPYLMAVQPDGTILWFVKLAEDTSDFFTQDLVRDAEGYTYLRSINNDLMVVDSEGTQVLFLESCCDRVVTLADGRVVLLKATAAGDYWTVLQSDLTSGQLKTLGSFPISLRNGGYYALFLPGTDDYDLYCVGNLSLYGMKLSDSEKPIEAESLLTWLNCDIDGTKLIAVANDADGGFLALTADSSQDSEAVVLTRQTTDPNQGKITLTMACRELPSSVSAAVRKFNTQSAEYHIEILDYGAASVDGVDRLTTDLNAGNIPDLFCTDGIDLQPLISGGWLEDLWPYIDADEVLSRDSLVEPLFDAMSVNGSLYTVTGGFTLKTTLALSSVVGDEPGWSIAEMQQSAASLPDLELIANGYTREEVMNDILHFYAQSFLDREAGTASFDSAEFVELLEYAAQYPEEVSRDDDAALPEKRKLFHRVEIYNLMTGYRMQQARWSAGAEGSVWKGYPGIAGSGCVFNPETPMAMSAGGKHKDAAWEFLRSILLPENQGYDAFWVNHTDSYSFLPSNKSVFDAMVQDACNRPKDLIATTYTTSYGLTVEVYEWSAEEAEAFYDLIDNTVVVEQPEDAVSDIIRDEMQRFFAGQQDAKAAAAAIQNRVNLYLAEMG